MRKNLFRIAIACIGLLAACKKDNDTSLQPVSINVGFKVAEEMGKLDISFKTAKVTISNIVTGQKYTGVLDTDAGQVTFNSVVPGNYNIAVSLDLSAKAYETATGIKSDGTVFFSGAANAQAAMAPQNNFTVELRTGSNTSTWLIKQIYYAGSNTKDGALFRDQFVELYNNSDQVLYADSLYLCQVEGVETALEQIDFAQPWVLPTGQWNWAVATGMAATNPNTDYIYAASLFRIPGNGTTYPVQPGNSIIIAATAINHKAPYQDASGKTITVRNPDLTVDLQGADFDVYMGNQPGINPLPSDLNTNTPHLTVVHNFNRDFVMDANGREGIMIFRSQAATSTWKSYKTPNNTTDGKLKMQLPKKDMQILDVVETQQTPLNKRGPKRISLDLDAGFNFVGNGAYSSQALLRKTKQRTGGRVILQDTNNSSVDFITIKADPSKKAFSN
ncbi:DUF4876 domain-containing protein [Chitinophaga sp. G-6-1-13]|uniref:DUF4876 domain-containing protein n=1 Tax=Chitinophaga fulva TaxID=2728842 RepID=A0A848GPC3_9BACT|nr:DUF4876 domain-containing protein [Chitinophaga fulva]NML39827.1 DUF4876 domain-containing protein [Chitinophaga fulva]